MLPSHTHQKLSFSWKALTLIFSLIQPFFQNFPFPSVLSVLLESSHLLSMMLTHPSIFAFVIILFSCWCGEPLFQHLPFPSVLSVLLESRQLLYMMLTHPSIFAFVILLFSCWCGVPNLLLFNTIEWLSVSLATCPTHLSILFLWFKLRQTIWLYIGSILCKLLPP